MTDRTLHKRGLLDKAKASLRAAGFRITILHALVADPSEKIVTACAAMARAADIDKMAVVMFASD